MDQIVNMKYLQLELGGEKRGLKFDIGTLKCLHETYNVEPFDFRTEANKLTEVLPFATKIIHSAMLRNCEVKKEPPGFTQQQVEEWVYELDLPVIQDVVTAYNGIFIRRDPSANGEVGADTQQVIV